VTTFPEPPPPRCRLAAVLLAFAAGCAARQSTTAPPPAAPAPPPPQAGPAVFRRLTLFEYRNTIRDLLGIERPATEVPVDTASGRSGYPQGGSVSWIGARTLLEDAEELARRAVATDGLLPCQPSPEAEAEQQQCAERFVNAFGRRAYRRALTGAESRALLDLYREQRAVEGHQFTDAIRVMVTAMLMSPRLLYHWETTPGPAPLDGALVRLSGDEIASRLSYLLWASMPDQALFAAADAGKLAEPSEIARQVRRMLADPRASDGIAEFFVQWLDLSQVPELNKNKKRYKTYSPALAGSMLEEIRQLAVSVVLKGDGRLDTLLTSPAASVDEKLAGLYDVEVAPGAERAEVKLDPEERSGILTRAGFLAAHATYDDSHPIRRGVAIAQRVLCIDLPSPPENVPPPKPPAEGLSTRERFAEHSHNPCATVCHDLFDPLGLAFENYDGIGAYRDEDGGKPVDASGDFTADGVYTKFANAVELIKFLSRSRNVHDCMAQQWLRYALRRRETKADEGSLAQVQESFARTSDLRELLVGLATTPSFTRRARSPGEVVK
jgi:hypothetical protein